VTRELLAAAAGRGEVAAELALAHAVVALRALLLAQPLGVGGAARAAAAHAAGRHRAPARQRALPGEQALALQPKLDALAARQLLDRPGVPTHSSSFS
jgi:hypothetical protein